MYRGLSMNRRLIIGGTKYIRGVTLIELLVAIAIVAIMSAIGIPSFQRYKLEQQAEAQREAMLNSLSTARVAAQRFSVPVNVCPSSDAASCGNDWNQGWIVYLDNDRDDQLSNGEQVLFAHQYQGKIQILTANSRFRFLPNGMTTTASLNICSDDMSELNRAISINPVGAIELQGSSDANCATP